MLAAPAKSFQDINPGADCPLVVELVEVIRNLSCQDMFDVVDVVRLPHIVSECSSGCIAEEPLSGSGWCLHCKDGASCPRPVELFGRGVVPLVGDGLG